MCAKLVPGMTEEARDSVVPGPAARSIAAVSGALDERIESEMDTENHLATEGLKVGDRHHRAFIGPRERYDLLSAMQFNLLAALGLRETHRLLDIGCGSLRAGRLFIVYLLPGRYHGIEPEEWLLRDGVAHELGNDLVELKRPRFAHNRDFSLGVFETDFDFLVAQSIFSHASRQQIRTCLAEARKVMHSESIFAATFFEGEESYQGKDWVYPGCVAYKPSDMEAMAAEEGFVFRAIDWPHSNEQSWAIFHFPEKDMEFNPSPSEVPAYRDILAKDLENCRERLRRIESHPYVRFGLALRRVLMGLRKQR